MPELPEVEVLGRQLNQELIRKLKKDKKSSQISQIIVSDLKLRTDSKKTLVQCQFPVHVLKIKRRSKFLIFYLDKGFLISHLGMSGSWRMEKKQTFIKKKHDHVIIQFSNFESWIYNDPRRFGFFEFSLDFINHPWIKNLGPEPLDNEFNFESFFYKIKSSDRTIKTLIMDAKIIVGVGNIYASEALFMARIKPSRKGNKISKVEAQNLLKKIQTVLLEAIESGGSTLKDYFQLKGQSGSFQNQHLVYGKDFQPCSICRNEIKKSTLGGRGTFYCDHCQK